MFDAYPVIQLWLPYGIGVFCAAIFLDSLRFKFSDHPKTQEIFGRLDAWAGSLGARGLFARTGPFSQYVIGIAEMVASALILAGLFVPSVRFLLAPGAMLGLAVMSGAIGFHLFTPLGIDPNRDGGGLFRAACLVWAGCFAILILRWDEVGSFIDKARVWLAPVAG